MGLHMAEHDTPTPWPPRRCCTGESCKQGRAECETPEACMLPERADHLLEGYARGIVSALLVGAIVAFVLVVTR